MNIIVCVKAVLDPDLPPVRFAIDRKNKLVVPPEGMPYVINPYDALAVEAAVRIKEKEGGHITVIGLGDKSWDVVIRKTLAMGADEAAIICDPAFTGADSFETAYILTKAVQKIGSFDLILCGRQASDWDNGVVGSIMAEYLDLPMVTRIKGVEVTGNKLMVQRAIMNGNETYELDLPALLTVSNEFGQARIPLGRGIIMAARKNIPLWNLSDLGCDAARVGADAVKNKIHDIYLPSYERKCEMVTGTDLSGAVDRLAKIVVSSC